MEGAPPPQLQFQHSNTQQQMVLVGNRTIRLLKKLGEGAFGEIFIGVNTHSGVEVAVKR